MGHHFFLKKPDVFFGNCQHQRLREATCVYIACLSFHVCNVCVCKCMCMCKCMCIMYIYIYVYICTYIYIYMCVCARVTACVCLCLCFCVYVCGICSCASIFPHPHMDRVRWCSRHDGAEVVAGGSQWPHTDSRTSGKIEDVIGVVTCHM